MGGFGVGLCGVGENLVEGFRGGVGLEGEWGWWGCVCCRQLTRGKSADNAHSILHQFQTNWFLGENELQLTPERNRQIESVVVWNTTPPRQLGGCISQIISYNNLPLSDQCQGYGKIEYFYSVFSRVHY